MFEFNLSRLHRILDADHNDIEGRLWLGYPIPQLEEMMAIYDNPVLYIPKAALPYFVECSKQYTRNSLAYNWKTKEYNLYGVSVPVVIVCNSENKSKRFILRDHHPDDTENSSEYTVFEMA